MHRDISPGNILIYPIFMHNSETGTSGIIWIGLLSDWEMGKVIPPERKELQVFQPLRTVRAPRNKVIRAR